MSDDLIKRSDAINAINSVGWLEDAEYEERILAIPTIEPKRGEWVNQHKWSNGFFERECSVCGAMKPILRHTAKINFCPNCGAKMEEVEDEE